MSELLREDERVFRNYMGRICPELYQELVERPRLLKKDFYEKSTALHGHNTNKYSFLTIIHAVELPYNFRGTSVVQP